MKGGVGLCSLDLIITLRTVDLLSIFVNEEACGMDVNQKAKEMEVLEEYREGETEPCSSGGYSGRTKGNRRKMVLKR